MEKEPVRNGPLVTHSPKHLMQNINIRQFIRSDAKSLQRGKHYGAGQIGPKATWTGAAYGV